MARRQGVIRMKVRSILNTKGREVVTIEPEARAMDAVMLMRRTDIGALVVIDRHDHIVGLLSEREVTRCLATASYRIVDMRVAHVMKRTVVTCDIDDELVSVMTLMTYDRARHIPVLEGGRLSGIVSLGDVVKARLAEVEMELRVLRDLQTARLGSG
jgi:CBS domain-containing protein